MELVSNKHSQLAIASFNGWVDDAEAKHSTSADCDADVVK
jgi:hypothetical protein